MPELPEVEIMTRNVRDWLSGQTLTALDVLDAKLLPFAAAGALSGVLIGPATRRGKYLCLPLGAQVLVLHFRMTGKAVLETSPRRHVRLRLHTPAATVAFVDTRRLGRAWLLPAAALEDFFDAIPMGPEPWPLPRSGAWWAERLIGLRGAIKPAMMRQDRIAGLGNIAASEICHRARVHPACLVPALLAAEYDALAGACSAFIAHVLEAESGPEVHYVSQGAPTPAPFLVYGRAGEACACGGQIERTSQSGRATFFCPTCQRR